MIQMVYYAKCYYTSKREKDYEDYDLRFNQVL